MKKAWQIKLICSSFVFLPLLSHAVEFTVMVREGKKLEKQVRELPGLEGQSSFDGQYFRIVNGKSEEAISFNDDPEIIFKAATAYYHLSVAHDYFKQLDPDGEHLDSKVKVRIEHSNRYSSVTKFTDDKYDPQFNNALTVEGSGMLKDDDVDDWGNEIWFRPSKPIKSKSEVTRIAEIMNSKDMKSTMTEALVMSELTNMTSNIARTGYISSYNMQFHVFSIVASLGIAELLPRAFLLSTKNIKTNIHLDSVLIPEIIYHEYAHIALGEWFGFNKQTPVVEGIPNYFASKISKLDVLAARTKKYSKGYTGVSGKAKALYHAGLEDQAHHSFVFKMLSRAEEAFGEDAEKVFYEMIEVSELSSDSNIRENLVKALHLAANKSKNPAVVKLKLHKILTEFGL